jgi:hypothetical protein
MKKHRIVSELEASINNVNKRSGMNFGSDYRYSNINHPDHVSFRSDHYPFIHYGIPSVWFFSGLEPDCHSPRGATHFINNDKFYKIAKLAFLTAFVIGKMKGLLKLDANPGVTLLGKHNLTDTSLFQYT